MHHPSCVRPGHGDDAEGVEKEVQMRMLTNMGCTTVQEYYTGRPIPSDEIVARYATQHGQV